VFAEWELDVPVVRVSSIIEGEGHGEMVELRSHVVNEITESETHRLRRKMTNGDGKRLT